MTIPLDQELEAALERFQLGESETLLRLDGEAAFSRAELLLIQQAKREIFIVTPDFEPERYNDAGFADALSAFVRRSRFTDARILVGDPTLAIRWGHHVVTLARRLSSNLKIRQLHEEDAKAQHAWIVADDIGMLRRDGTDVFKGALSARSIPHAQRARRQFIEMWERSSEVPDFRQLNL